MRTLKTVVVSAICFFGAVSSGSNIARAADADTSVAVEDVAMIRVQVRIGAQVFRAPVRAVPWGEGATFVVDAAGRRHVVQLHAQAKAGRASVRLSYERDGATVASGTTHEVKPRRLTSVFADDEAAIAVTIIPTRVSIAAH